MRVTHKVHGMAHIIVTVDPVLYRVRSSPRGSGMRVGIASSVDVRCFESSHPAAEASKIQTASLAHKACDASCRPVPYEADDLSCVERGNADV